MIIPCPWCGDRPHGEFAYGGDATVRRPDDPAKAGDAEWFDYVYIRNNPAGPHRELWHHAFGCGQWIEVRRDTLTHRIEGAAPASGAAGGGDG